MPTPHLFALADAMAEHVPIVRFVTLDALDPERAALGWTSTASERVIQAHAGDATAVRVLMAGYDGASDVHLLPGLKPSPWLHPVQRELWPTRARIVIMAEAALPFTGWRALALDWRDQALAAVWRNRAELVLAMGTIGVERYRAIGFPAEKVREFGYFPDLAVDIPTEERAGGKFRLAFVGALIERKGLDLLLSAMAMRGDWPLRVVGVGPQRAALQADAVALGVAERVEWLGRIATEAIPALLAEADCAVVPSRFDGWGAVTNEALGVGTPVLASDCCGSAAVLIKPELGTTFASGDPMSLAIALDRVLAYGHDRVAIRSWAHKRLTPAAGADYLTRLLAGEHDALPPWRQTSETGR